MKKFQFLEALPETGAELDAYAGKLRAAINVFQARADNGEEFEAADVEELESLNKAYLEADSKIAEVTTQDQDRAARLDAALAAAKAATAPKPAPEPEKKPEPKAEAQPEPEPTPAPEPTSDVVAEAEQVTQEAAAEPQVVTAAAESRPFASAVANNDLPTPDQAKSDSKRWALTASAPNFADHHGLVDTAVIAAGISSQGQFTGLNPDARTVLARMERPQGKVFENADEFYAELDRLGSEIPGHGAVSAQALVAAGGWCAPSEQLYDFCETPAAVGLLSFPELAIKRGGVIFPAEPDFSALQTGFHFTEPQLEAVDGQGEPTAIKNFVEIPCPPDMVEYRLEAIGWAVKSGILQKRAWPELIKKFLDEFMVEHQYRVSAKSLLKVLAQSSTAKVVPNDAVLGATTGILNGLHIRARNLQIKSRKPVIEGIAPIWFRDVLKADLAGRDGLDVLNVTDAQVDAWLAARGIYLQYEGRWQSLGAGQPGHEDTSWWPGSVDVVLYPAGTFWRSLQNVLTLGASFPMDMVQKNRQMEGFVEDEFQVGKRCGPSHLIRIPLCINGAVGAREQIDCSGPYNAKVTKSFNFPGTPTGGGVTFKFSGASGVSASVAYNDSTGNVDTKLTGIDDGVTAAGDITVTGGPLPGTAVSVNYPAELGDLQVAINSLTGGTQPGAGVPIT
ncbi:major capsid protein [Mycobacterium yunnanensis]|uniref:Major capsid protein n=1 Tax=Mycobacterium yunnanensis TaxID=368477 RepID=A0A9X2Z827_9MYCO|nr:major capsid protein [Mycobacterium yunnanensis]MCV7424349.1 major capsid protein [Mycobacterium yunnanensis]